MCFGFAYVTTLMDYSLSSPSGEDEPRTIAIGGRAKNLRIPLMWDAYIQTDGLLKVDKTKEKTTKSPERPLESELASLQVRTLLSKSLLVPAGTHVFLRLCSPFLSRCLHPIRLGHLPQEQYSVRRDLWHHYHTEQHQAPHSTYQERSGLLSTLTGLYPPLNFNAERHHETQLPQPHPCIPIYLPHSLRRPHRQG